MNKRRSPGVRLVVCVCNDGYPASLELRKMYRTIADRAASAHDLVRVVDESGEDYVYPARYFMPVTLPTALRRALRMGAVPAARCDHAPRRRQLAAQ